MEKSDHEKIAEKHRDQARLDLIDHYIRVAAENSRDLEYGFLNVRGQEVPDPTVVEPPLGYIAQPDLMEQMRRMVRTEMSRIAELEQFESFEEADDFDIDDDPVDYTTPYEMYFDPEPAADQGPPAPPTHPARLDPNAPPAPLNGEVLAPQPQPTPPGEPNKGA